MNLSPTPLLTDLYQLNMLAAYLDHGLTDTAVFELFVRKLPARRGFLMAAGLEQALCYLEALSFSEADIARSAISVVFPTGCSNICAAFVLPAMLTPSRKALSFSRTSRSCGSSRRCRRHSLSRPG